MTLSREVIAIDPGTQRTGYAIYNSKGILVDHGVIKCNGSPQTMVSMLSPLIFDHNNIGKIIIEDQFVSRLSNPKSIGMVRFMSGVIVGAITSIVNSVRLGSGQTVEVVTVMPRSWQSKTVGLEKGQKCTKELIRMAASEIAGAKTLNDESDAVCIGQWYFKHGRFVH
jgi:Holliday junction resolvasome RuvABC endonuclease subunit